MSKLEVIAGGAASKADPATPDLEAKQRQVDRIRAEALRWRAGATSPRKTLAYGVSVLAFLTAIAAIELAERVLQVRLSTLATAAVAGCVLLAVFVLVMRKSKAALTQAGLVDDLLNAYFPLSPEAFRALQTATLERGDIDIDLVITWVEQETEVIQAAAGRKVRPERAFLKRQI